MPTFSQEVSWATGAWQNYVAAQYIIAYNNAYKAVQKTLQDEEDDSKAQAQLFASIVSILPSSLLMAAVNAPIFRRSITRIAVRRLGAQNLRATLSLMKSGGEHPVTAFAFGKAADLIKSTGNRKVEAIMTNLVGNTSGGVTSTDPLRAVSDQSAS